MREIAAPLLRTSAAHATVIQMGTLPTRITAAQDALAALRKAETDRRNSAPASNELEHQNPARKRQRHTAGEKP
jgi:hypothetical protein